MIWPADSDSVHKELAAQVSAIHHHEQQLTAIAGGSLPPNPSLCLQNPCPASIIYFAVHGQSQGLDCRQVGETVADLLICEDVHY